MLETLRTLSQLKPYLTTSNPSPSLSAAATTADHHHRRPPPPPTYPLFSLSPPPPPTYPLFSLPPPPPPTATTSDLSSLLSAAATTATTDTYRGDFSLPGAALRAKGLNRIGNLLVPDDNYCKFEDWIIPIFDQMLEEQSTKVF